MADHYQTQTSKLLGWFAIAFLLVLSLKLVLASLLDLYSDEIFYWWAGTKLAIAYSDLPFMTALLAGLGSGFGPADSFSVRLLFLILGSLLPGLVYWVARPISNHQQAIESAMLTLCLPLAGFMGLLAVPDVPLIFFGLLSIGFFQRALSRDTLVYWCATGLFVALGLSTHYRFFLYPLAAILFLGFFSAERSQWKNWKFWCAVSIASLGLFPILWFNLSNQLSSASFYLVERHPWEFQSTGLLHIFKQAGLVTPPLYIALLYTLVNLWREGCKGNRDSALLFAFASVNLAVYCVLAPWTDANSTSIHWPLSGYFPLLIALPISLRTLFRKFSERWNESTARKTVILIPSIGFIGTLLAFIGVGSQAFQEELQPILGTGVLSNKMAGWREFASYTEELLAENYIDQSPLIVTDNYYTAAQLEFAGLTTNSLTLDDDKAVRDGRITQLVLWEKDASNIKNFAGYRMLYINEDSSLILEDKTRLISEICQSVESINQLQPLRLYNGDKEFSYYKADRINVDSTSPPAFPCPYPMQAWIDFPVAGDVLSRTVQVTGWAFNEDIGIDEVELLVDNEIVGAAQHGISRQDVVDIQRVVSDPNAPDLGFSIEINTAAFENGKHEIAIALTNSAGIQTIYGSRTVEIAN